MKRCSSCNRTYRDDTLVFCLDDGARLSAINDPLATLPAGRDTDPSATLIIPPELAPANQTALGSTIPAVMPLAYSQEARQAQPTTKHGGKHWIVIGGMLAFIIVGLMIVLGYLSWKVINRSVSEPSVTSAAPTYNNVPANANKAFDSKQTDKPNLQWLDGVWEGEGYQSDTKTTWDVRLAVQDGMYAIEYPNIPCRGKWNLIQSNSSGARFVEVITQGTDRCANNSHIMLQKVNDSEISCKYTYANNRAVIATAVLSKKAQSTEQK